MSNYHSNRFVTLVDDAKVRIKEITPRKVNKKLNSNSNNFVLLDVREKDEWDSSRIPGADYLGKGIIERDIESKCPNIDQEIVLYCRDGYRSILAADNLKRMGYNNVKSMAGGFRSWVEAGLPISEGKDQS